LGKKSPKVAKSALGKKRREKEKKEKKEEKKTRQRTRRNCWVVESGMPSPLIRRTGCGKQA
jgi:hypothetical protein